jgi:hypothetical protein
LLIAVEQFENPLNKTTQFIPNGIVFEYVKVFVVDTEYGLVLGYPCTIVC